MYGYKHLLIKPNWGAVLVQMNYFLKAIAATITAPTATAAAPFSPNELKIRIQRPNARNAATPEAASKANNCNIT